MESATINKDTAEEQLDVLLREVISMRKKYPKKIIEFEKTRINNELDNLLKAEAQLENQEYKSQLLLLSSDLRKLISNLPKDSILRDSYEEFQKTKSHHSEVLKYLELRSSWDKENTPCN